MSYDFKEIERKWQRFWQQNQTFKAEDLSKAPKFYVLDMFPYPSGAGLHVGHPLGYIASDIYARYKRHQGYNVLHPMGYDSFGLPAEQYAIQTGQHPATTTEVNSKRYREQLDRIGFSLDWSREVKTSDPAYYKHTQWVFIQLFQSWYDKKSEQAKPISELVQCFEREGNRLVQAHCDSDVPLFDAQQWLAMSELDKEQTLQYYRLAFLADIDVNWCPELGTVLANDEIVNGVSERGGHPVIRKKMRQWSMRITAYAERLLKGLSSIDWPQPLKDAQTNWIGRSEGAVVHFEGIDFQAKISVFTTRPDTLFGVSFMTLAPEHELVLKITTESQRAQVEAYIAETAMRSELDRMSDVKRISGVFTGAYVKHPFTAEPIPVWIGDYVLASYGTGAVMAVPCGDQRDYEFAKHFDLPIPNIFEGVDISQEAFADKEKTIIANSDFLNGLSYAKAKAIIIARLESEGNGRGVINYRLRDAVFSRQRYWGEPFPIYYDNGIPRALPFEALPLELPEVEQYLPTAEGDPPLGNATKWAWNTQTKQLVDNVHIDHQTVFPLELNTMPGWAGSSQYFNRFMDPQNDDELVSAERVNYWKEVDLYIGGSEHATTHLLYARFWQHFMFDLGKVPQPEFARKLINQGMITGLSAIIYRKSGTQQYFSYNLIDHKNAEAPNFVNHFEKIRVDVSLINGNDELDIEALKAWQPQYKAASFELENGVYTVGREIEKMSKRWHNVVNPDQICDQYGADSLRLYEMFLGPLEQSKPWNTAGITGAHSFLKKLWRLYEQFNEETPTPENLKTLHKTIKKVTEDLDDFSFNTSVSSFMICVNELTAQKCASRAILEPLAVLISPYAPHIAEELWQRLGYAESIVRVRFPEFDASYLVESEKEYPVSFNGKLRFKLMLPSDLSKEAIEEAVMKHHKTAQQLAGSPPKKVIIVPGKIINIVH
ncbi:MAG: leucine--tRNA ligase [Bacteroidetes bacterium]|nr:leucine--tRNA ligase [Bacteroidota bacterium]